MAAQCKIYRRPAILKISMKYMNTALSYKNVIPLIALLAGFICETAAAAKRIAFVVGNSNYKEIKSLPNPGNDSTDIGNRLQALGFELHGDQVHHDLTKRSLQREFNRFARTAERAEIAFFYFAGHGMQFNGSPHLLPVDIPNDDLNIVQSDAISLDRLLKQLNSKAKLTVAVFDACREIPDYSSRIQKVTRGSNGLEWRGLSRPAVSLSSALIAFSGGSGELVADGTGRNSPYTSILLDYLDSDRLEQEKLDIPDVFSEVSYQFRKRHDGQSPEVINKGVRPNRFYLASKPTQAIRKGKPAWRVTPQKARVCIFVDGTWKCDPNTLLPLGRQYKVMASAKGYQDYSGSIYFERDGQILKLQLDTKNATTAPPTPPPPSPSSRARVEKVVLSFRALFPSDDDQLTSIGAKEMEAILEK